MYFRLCSPVSVPHHFRSTGNQLVVRFRSDGSVQLGGFTANWTMIPPGESVKQEESNTLE